MPPLGCGGLLIALNMLNRHRLHSLHVLQRHALWQHDLGALRKTLLQMLVHMRRHVRHHILRDKLRLRNTLNVNHLLLSIRRRRVQLVRTCSRLRRRRNLAGLHLHWDALCEPLLLRWVAVLNIDISRGLPERMLRREQWWG